MNILLSAIVHKVNYENLMEKVEIIFLANLVRLTSSC